MFSRTNKPVAHAAGTAAFEMLESRQLRSVSLPEGSEFVESFEYVVPAIEMDGTVCDQTTEDQADSSEMADESEAGIDPYVFDDSEYMDEELDDTEESDWCDPPEFDQSVEIPDDTLMEGELVLTSDIVFPIHNCWSYPGMDLVSMQTNERPVYTDDIVAVCYRGQGMFKDVATDESAPEQGAADAAPEAHESGAIVSSAYDQIHEDSTNPRLFEGGAELI